MSDTTSSTEQVYVEFTPKQIRTQKLISIGKKVLIVAGVAGVVVLAGGLIASTKKSKEIEAVEELDDI
jgi:hypothetical protein